MSEKLCWGVLGNATIARVCVIPAIQKSRNGRVRALASRSPQEATEVVNKNGIPKVYGDYYALIEDPEIEAIYIPLPNYLHHEWALKALSVGKHVLCEKPLACNARQAQEMADSARSAGCRLMEAFMYRYHPRSIQVRQLVNSGIIGNPLLVRTAFCYRMAVKDYENSYNARLKPEMGGGALLDVGCYGVSVAHWLFGSAPVQVQCQAHYHPGGVDLHTVGTLIYEDGRIATLEASFISGLQQTYAVVGEKGVIELPHNAFIPWEKDVHFTLRENNAEHAEPIVVGGADEYQLMVEYFADTVRGAVAPEISTSESIDNMRVIDALTESARTGIRVAV